jgi:diguanylate cyclase (GGDEF)-like protein/PAS domain S-box-containing protein
VSLAFGRPTRQVGVSAQALALPVIYVQEDHLEAVPRWIDTLCVGLAIYVAFCAAWMLTGAGGPTAMHYVGLLADVPPLAVSTILAVAAARGLPVGPRRNAWRCIAGALAIYLAGETIGVAQWMRGHDPFPGPADLFYLAFYVVLLGGLGFMIRAATASVRWVQFSLDALILILGFGAFFWFLVIRPTASGSELDVIKHALSQAYIALNCVVVLSIGVLLVAGDAGSHRGQRVTLLLALGFATMFLGDILWAVAKIRGSYLPGALQDVLYVICYVPLAMAARAQLRPETVGMKRGASQSLVQSLPYAAMLAAFLVLGGFAVGEIGTPTSVMTIVVFALAMLVMVRQGVVLRENALSRERRAARLVEARYASLIANASDAIMIVTLDGYVRFASPASEQTLGVKPHEADGSNLLQLWGGGDGERLRAFLYEVAATHERTIGPVEFRIERGNTSHVFEIVGSNLLADPAVQGLALNLRDISERKALEEQLRQLAFHDSLTLLANRGLFRDRVQHAVTLAQRGHHQAVVMFLDLDNFKNINDSLGHDAGDRLLQAVAQRLIKATRSSDTVARLGGDEFAILLEGTTSVADVESLATTLIEQLAQPFTVSATEVRVSASIGVAFSSAEVSAEALLSRADIAMYHAKAAGKGQFVTFQPQMQETLLQRLRLEADISRAIGDGEIFLEYQPVVDLGTRSLLGVEALVRWRHPELGVLLPSQFIQIAEECGQIVRLGRWVLNNACSQLMAWRGSIAGGAGLRVNVNVSGRHLQFGDLVNDVAQALRDSGLEAENLVIELTETTIMHNTEANLGKLHELKALGVRLAIDDFGTGYSSLSYLHRFPIDILKIDQSFVGRLTNSESGPELARAVITLADTLGLDTVAEGIEIDTQVEALLNLGCVAGQGYLFSIPGSLERLSQNDIVARRNALWTAAADREKLSPSGRFAALRQSLPAA